MGVVARYPIALAPGMGLNAYFTYTVCLKMHIPWQTALGAVFLSGVIFLLITAAGIRQMILRSIPHELYAAVASGIGLFIAFIGFRNAGLVVGDPATLVSLGNIRNPTTALALFGLILMVALEIKKVRGSILIGVLVTTRSHGRSALVHWTPAAGGIHALAATAFQLDIRGALSKGLLEIIFVFFFVDLFDNLGTLVAVTKRAGLISADHSIPRLNRILFADATAPSSAPCSAPPPSPATLNPPPASPPAAAPASPPSSPACSFCSPSSPRRSSASFPPPPPRPPSSSSAP